MQVILLYILITISNLWGQWALWGNPSLPVGNSDKGIGLWSGQLMLGLDNNYQNIIWSHPEIDNENANYEIGDGDHSGQLSTKIISPTITIGLSD